jgi:Mg-chelatase subunit ChlD
VSYSIKSMLSLWLVAVAFSAALIAQNAENSTVGEKDQNEKEAVFRSDIAMGRIDVQVLDRDLRAVPSLTEDDFILRRGNETLPIRNFSYQQMPVDVLLLLDVSGSMRPQVERVASASNRALRVLGDEDRVAIMVFTTRARVSMKFAENRQEIERQLDETVSSASFSGGTNINRALLDAAEFIVKEARPDARHAIIIVTDDIAKQIDRERVGMALSEADAVLMALVTPAALEHGNGPWGSPGGGYPGGGYPGSTPPVILSPWPGGRGGVWGSPYPRRGPGGTPWPGGPEEVPQAGTSEVARESGGEGFPSSDANSLEAAFTRIREQYSMYFYLPDGASPEDAATIAVDLADNARARHRDVELRYRQIYLAGNDRRTFVKRARPGPPTGTGSAPAADSPPKLARRSRPTSERTGPNVQLTSEKSLETPDPGSKEPAAAPAPQRRRAAVSEPDGPRAGPMR